ncbi:hypothetical protein UFOVP1124_40 [uncultured Caudovirales phage]|uniref:Uncharacterized protein n=1 Tax=uncultured Caudovirales phage TaxID=2100421 RepID=A0A6J5QQG7_9CAUD|nr:hypothetical protein UFOVP1124_40 [uncultured Caudovirales phage]
MNDRLGRPVDPDRERLLISQFGPWIEAAPLEDLPGLRKSILDRLDLWELGAPAAYRLLKVLEFRLHPCEGLSRITPDGGIVPIDVHGGGDGTDKECEAGVVYQRLAGGV